MNNNMENNKENNECFFITPIGSTKSNEREKMNALKDEILNPILSEFNLKLSVANTIDEAGSITDQIFQKIVNSRLVIVDLTGLNPNVMYELAVRHSFGLPCVMICDIDTKLPFDILADRTIFFSNTIQGSGELKKELRSKIESALNSKVDNPVIRAVNKATILEHSNEDNMNNLIVNMLDQVLGVVSKIERENEFNNNNNYSNKLISKILKIRKQLQIDLEREPTIDEISMEALMSPREVEIILSKAHSYNYKTF
ncbi:hypothetical protein ACV7JQ_09110 [Globicatella sulfidifaciens]